MIDLEERVEKAGRLFKEGGYNCCQPEFPAEPDTLYSCDGLTRTSLLLFQEIRSGATIRSMPCALPPTGRSL